MNDLDREIQTYVSLGFMVVHRTDTTAQLRRPKQFNILAAIILALISFGLLFILYVIVYAGKQDDLVYLSVDSQGIVHATGSGVAIATAGPRNRWEAEHTGKSRAELADELERARQSKAAPEYIHWLEREVNMRRA